MDLLLGAVPKTASATSVEPAVASADAPALAVALPQPDHAPMALLEETGEMEPASASDSTELAEVSATSLEGPASELPAPIFAEQESPVGEVVAVEAPSDGAAEPVAATEPELTSEPVSTMVAPKARRRRSQAAAAVPLPAPVVEASAAPLPAAAQPRVEPAVRRRRDPDEDLEPAYVPIKVTVSIPAVVLSELIRTVQTIRRMTGRRQPVNQGTVIAAALEMAFEEFKTKGATSQLVDKLRIE